MLGGADLRAVRALRGVTQAELAAKTGMTQTAVAEYELGKREIRTDTLRRICEALNVQVVLKVGDVEFRWAPPVQVEADDKRSARIGAALVAM